MILSGCRGDGYNIEFNWLQSTLYLINWKALLRCILFRVPGINIISTVQNNNELLKDSLCVLHWMESSTQQTEVLKQQIKTCNALMSYLRVIVNQRVLSPKNSNTPVFCNIILRLMSNRIFIELDTADSLFYNFVRDAFRNLT